jgi:hypothetical protein
VTTVPTIAPTVPMPDRRPTTVPVSSRLVRRSLMTIGVTADSSAAGTRMVSDATRDSSSGAVSATVRTTAGVTATATPDTPSNGASARLGSIRSAARPPLHAPIAIAPRAMPMTRVLVSRVRPRYGASNRSAVTSTTSTAAEAPKTRAAAVRSPRTAGEDTAVSGSW